MSEPTAGEIAFACMREFVDELARCGVDSVCISPGSRSTPLVLAFARHGGFRVFTHLDERASAFFALGRAKVLRAPVALVCTSGTAATNFFPAVVEASMSHVPLIVLTADRPPRLRGRGANQTIDQVELYGKYPRLFVEAPVPRAHPAAASEWRALARSAFAMAQQSTEPGPVHLNLPFDEPLIPTDAAVDLGASAPEPLEEIKTALPDLDEIASACDTERGLVVAGQLDHDASAILDLAERLSWPVVAEPTSGLRVPERALAAGQALLTHQDFSRAHQPDVVLQFGATPTSRPTQRLVATAGRLIVLGQRPADPDAKAWRTVVGPEAEIARALHEAANQNSQSTWTKEWLEADRSARASLDTFLDQVDEPFEPKIARNMTAALPNGSMLVVASSTPVRDLDFAMAPRDGLQVLANRGASGIDGFASKCLGVASTGTPTFALAGDLSMLHDTSGLIWAARERPGVTFVVLNNQGGGIFDLLPSAALPENEALFVTPHNVDLKALADAAGVAYARAEMIGDQVAVAPEWTTLIDVHIDRARAVQLRGELRATIERAL
jgi:2-succinyl-5-enolpyruvyl-6-hydroxy-3-cyclohexene-1-carboxylate synthase